MVVSTAKSPGVLLTESSKSFTQNKKRSSPSVDPCSTLKPYVSDFIHLNELLPEKKQIYHILSRAPNPIMINLVHDTVHHDWQCQTPLSNQKNIPVIMFVINITGLSSYNI